MTGGTSSQYGAVFDVVKNGAATLTLTGTTTLASGCFLRPGRHDRHRFRRELQ